MTYQERIQYLSINQSARDSDEIRNDKCRPLGNGDLMKIIHEAIRVERFQREANERNRAEWIKKLDWNTLLKTKLFNNA
jgi:hypothetical protein